jgi:hypothetical protein
MRYRVTIVLIPFLLTLLSCAEQRDGAVAGTVASPTAGVRVTAMQNGEAVSSAGVNMQDGRFRMTLAPGAYDVSVSIPSSPLPMMFPGILVEPGKTTPLPPIDLGQPSGHAVLAGRVVPSGNGTTITLFAEGGERSAIQTDKEGKYQFIGLSAGNYTLRVNATGYAQDNLELAITNDRVATQNIRMICADAIDGVDWATGKIRVTGVGLPPANAANVTISREMARRAALADAERKLVKAIAQIKVGPGQSLRSLWGEKSYRERIQGFIKGYRVVGEHELDGGKIEIELELPLTGQSGLSRYLTE